MDWYLPNDAAEVGALRRELQTLLERHSVAGSDVDGALIAASELVTNAMQNSDSPVWASLDWGRSQPVLTVHDLGSGFELDDLERPEPADPRGRGLIIATHLASSLAVTAKAAGGSQVSAVLPVHRHAAVSIDPPRSRTQVLPSHDEMQPDGFFDREAFLRALVVQLAETIELFSGPTVAEPMVAQVGTDIGGRMEEAYRSVRGHEGDLEVSDIADLLVELKSAIGGDFFVISADDDRIVLGNRRCPFGDVVTKAPSLCRMTSSVFGGIARRNRGASAVDLEQRIAVGDAQCRVTVWLRPPPPERLPFLHVYGDFEATESQESIA